MEISDQKAATPKMKKSELKKDWLASSAVIAFAGVLLTAQFLQLPDTNREESSDWFRFSVPTVLILGLGAFLYVSSVFLAAASVIPSLRAYAIKKIPCLSPWLGLLALYTFTAAWISEFSKVPHEDWWREYLFYGGLGMFLFILFTITRKPLYETFRQIIRPKPKQDAKSDVPSVGEPPTTSELMSPPRQVHPPESRGPGIAAPAVIAVIGFTLGVVLCSRLRNNDN